MRLPFFVVALLATVSNALPNGAPLQSCTTLIPNHPTTNTDDSFGQFVIETELRDTGFEFEADESYNISLIAGTTLNSFRGFVIQSRDAADGSLIGSFSDLPATAQLLFCDGQDSTVTHVDRNGKNSIRLTWTAPASDGVVEIRYSVVISYRTRYYANLNAAYFPPSPAVCPFSIALSVPESFYPLSFGFPAGCQRSTCDYFLVMGPNRINNSYIDIYLEGNAQGWLAVGFSEDRGMSANMDVLGCRVTTRTGTVEIIDTWSSSSQENMPDDDQDGVCPALARFTNGRISCRFSRLIDIVNVGQDFNLNESYFLTFARRIDTQPPNTAGLNVSSVEVFSLFPDRRFNPVTDTFTNILPSTQNCPPPPGRDAKYVYTFGTPGSGYFFGARVNPNNSNYLDMRLEGDASGWVAIGFSETASMEESDVLGCKRDPSTDIVSVLNTYNPGPQGSRTPNELDQSHTGLCQFETQFTNGRILCTFSRQIVPLFSSSSRDFNLNFNLFQLYGMSNEGGPNTEGLPFHTPNTPTVSAGRVVAAQSLVGTRCPPGPDSDTEYLFTYGTRGRGYFFGAQVNPTDNNFLDITLEADTSGWVAVGFSQTPTMEESDVLGCKRDPVTGVVSVLDSWNPGPQGSRRQNELDQNQDGICLHRTQFVNGILSCTFSRLISALSDRDFSLNDNLFQLYGMSMNGGPNTTGFPFHEPSTPVVTTAAIDVVESSTPAAVFPRIDLLKAHGIIMILSWPMLAVTAIFFAAWMKPALPEGEWFQFHRAFMVGTVFFTTVGFVLAFVANARNPVPGLINFCPQGTNTAHFVIGIIILALLILNPLLSLCRCKTSSSKRWIYNISHGTLIGVGTELLALINVGLGIALLENSCGVGTNNYTILWIYIAFVGFLLATQVSLFVIFTFIAFREKDSTVRRRLAPSVFRYILPGSTTEDEQSQPTQTVTENIQASTAFQYIEMPDKESNSTGTSNEPKIKKIPSKDAPLRWVAFCSYLFIASILLLVIAIFIAIIP